MHNSAKGEYELTNFTPNGVRLNNGAKIKLLLTSIKQKKEHDCTTMQETSVSWLHDCANKR
jgi:hypothetical protein